MVDWADELKKKLENPEETADVQSAVSKMSEDILRTQEKVEQLAQRRDSLRKRLMQKISAIKAGMESGKEYFSNKKYERAREEFLKVLALDPENEEAKEYVKKIENEIYTTGSGVDNIEVEQKELKKKNIADVMEIQPPSELENELTSGSISLTEGLKSEMEEDVGLEKELRMLDKEEVIKDNKKEIIDKDIIKVLSKDDENLEILSGSVSFEKKDEVNKNLEDKELENVIVFSGEGKEEEKSILSGLLKETEKGVQKDKKEDEKGIVVTDVSEGKEDIASESVLVKSEDYEKRLEDKDLEEALKSHETEKELVKKLEDYESSKEVGEEEDSDLKKALEMVVKEEEVSKEDVQDVALKGKRQEGILYDAGLGEKAEKERKGIESEEKKEDLLKIFDKEKEEIEIASGSSAFKEEKETIGEVKDKDLEKALELLNEEKELKEGVFEEGKGELTDLEEGKSKGDVNERSELDGLQKEEEIVSGIASIMDEVSEEKKEDKDLEEALKLLESEKESLEEKVSLAEKTEEDVTAKGVSEKEVEKDENKERIKADEIKGGTEDEDLKEALSLLEQDKQKVLEDDVIVSGVSETEVLSGFSIEGDIEKYMEDAGITKPSKEDIDKKEKPDSNEPEEGKPSEQLVGEGKIEGETISNAKKNVQEKKEEDVLVEEVTEEELVKDQTQIKETIDKKEERSEEKQPEVKQKKEKKEKKNVELEISVEGEKEQRKTPSFIIKVKDLLPFTIIAFSGMVLASLITMILVVRSMRTTNKVDEILRKGAFEIREGKFDQGVNTLYDLVKFVENNNKLLDKYINAADIIYNAVFVSEEERLRKYKEARRIYDQIIESFPGNDYVLKKGVYFKAAECAKKLGLFEKSLKYYDEVISNFPKSTFVARAKYEKANTLTKMGYFNQARRLYAQVIKEYPDSEYAGRSYFKLAESYTLEAEKIRKEFGNK